MMSLFRRTPEPTPEPCAPDLDANVAAYDSMPRWMTR